MREQKKVKRLVSLQCDVAENLWLGIISVLT